MDVEVRYGGASTSYSGGTGGAGRNGGNGSSIGGAGGAGVGDGSTCSSGRCW